MANVRAQHESSATSIAVVAAIGMLAFGFRLFDIGDKSIWLDEAWSWRAAKLSIPDMADWTAQDKHPPLYYAVLHGCVAVFGDAEWALRLPSALVGAISVAILAAVAWRIGGPVLGVISGVLFAVHPTALEFAQEARMYPLAGLLALGSTIVLSAAVSRPSALRFGAYGLLAAPLIYTHYSGLFVLAVHAAVLVLYAVRRRDQSLLRGGALALAVVAIAYIPWYGNLIDNASDGVDHLADPSWALADLVLSSLLGLQRAESFWIAIALPLLGLGIWGVAKRVDDPYVTCIAALALVPVAQLAYTIVRSPVLDPRQASPYIAGVVLVMALGVVELGEYVADTFSRQSLARPIAGVAAAALAVILLWGTIDWYDRGPREDWRAAAAEIDDVPGAVYIWRAYIDVPLQYYSDHRVEPRSPRGARVLLADELPAALVLSHETPSEREALVREMSQSFTVGEPITFAGIVIYPLSPKTSASR
jgi:uncharacterized membrane protein